MTVFLNQEKLADLNGVDDTLDRVAHVYDADAQVVINTGLACSDFWASGTLALIEVPESGQGQTDLNGDSDAVDAVVHVFDAATGVADDFPLQLYDATLKTWENVGSGIFAQGLQVHEFNQGRGGPPAHRSDQEEFYQLLNCVDDQDLNRKLDLWEKFYNFSRPHGTFGGRAPYEILRERLQ